MKVKHTTHFSSYIATVLRRQPANMINTLAFLSALGHGFFCAVTQHTQREISDVSQLQNYLN